MAVVTLAAVVGDDRRLIVELPPEVPPGRVEVTIRSLDDLESASITAPNPRREALRAKLLAAGRLSAIQFASPGARALSEGERARAGTLPSGARPSEELIAEDRDRF